MPKNIRTLTIFYDTRISQKEVPLFRGAVVNSMGDNVNVLFHNHTEGDTHRYSYPLIQYKSLNGKAAITCVEEGADIIGQFLSKTSEPLFIGDREVSMDVEQIIPEKIDIRVSNTYTQYCLHHWLPLNSHNYEQYRNTDSLIERIQILENVLAGNILSFLTGVGIHLETRFDLSITDILPPRLYTYKGVNLMAFDIDFKANITLPSYIGIGKSASIGNGVLTKKQKTNIKS